MCRQDLNLCRVLISTYWNVNLSIENLNFLIFHVLISTYWNVNENFLMHALMKLARFNLNLLECKFFSACWHSRGEHVLISTYWNVNTEGNPFKCMFEQF